MGNVSARSTGMEFKKQNQNGVLFRPGHPAEVFKWENYYPVHRDLDNRAHLGFLYDHKEIFKSLF